jgi:actin-related protein
MADDDETPWLIMDYGSGTIQAGLSDNDAPRFMPKNCVGEPNYEMLQANSEIEDLLFHENLEHPGRKSGICKLHWPMSRGVVKDWQRMRKIWNYVLGERMLRIGVDARESPDECDIAGLFLTEPCLNSVRNREKVAEYWFEEQGIPRMFVGLQAVCALFSEGKSTGVAISSGDGVTEVLPVYEYYGMRHAYQRVNWGGKDVTNWLRRELHKADVALETSADELILWDMKENLCYLAGFGKFEEECQTLRETPREYSLPDHSVVKLNEQIIAVPEIIFNPLKAGKDVPGIHELAKQSIDMCPMDTKEGLFKNIICCGGNTLFRGFQERFQGEMENILGEDTKTKVFCPPDRQIKPWLGAKIICQVDHFTRGSGDTKMFVDRKDWDEKGVSCVARMSEC